MSEQEAGRSNLDVELEWPSAPEGARVTPSTVPAQSAPARGATTGAGGDTGVADLSGVTQLVEDLRKELIGFRSAVLGGELRELRAAVAELRAAVAELRSELLEEPALAELKAQGREVRAEVAELKVQVVELKAEMAEVSVALVDGPFVDELSAIREELVTLRRRIALRVQADPAP